MKNKGFTLIELICTILLLSIIVTLSTVAIVNVINNARERENESSMKLIETAAKDYFAKYENDYYIANGVNYCVDIKDLINENLLISKISYDGEEIKDKTIKVEYNNNTYNVAFDECKKYTITNLIANGSFENGKNSFSFLNNTDITNTLFLIGQNSAVNEGANQYDGVRKYSDLAIPATPNHKYYFSSYIYTEKLGTGTCSNGVGIETTETTWQNVGYGQENLKIWEKRHGIITIPDVNNAKIKFNLIGYSATDKLQKCYTDGILLVDLTETFGAGNEPSKEWCDQHIEYFDGTKVIYK